MKVQRPNADRECGITVRRLGDYSRAAMDDRTARAAQAASIRLATVAPTHAAARWAMVQYFAELDARFATGFDASGALDEAAAALGPPDGAFVLASSHSATIGCGGVQRIDDATGEIKRMWIHPDWRGFGLGRRLLAHLEAVAVALGRSRVVLDTNECLAEAIALYGRAGYTTIERYNDNPYAHHWFGKDL